MQPDSGLRDPFTKELVADASLHGAAPSESRLSLLPRFVIASLAALCAVVWSAIRYGDNRRPNAAASTWLAAHGEWANRTRHLLGLASADGRELPMLVLGRPRGSIKSVESLFGKHLDGNRLRLYRPISLPAALAAMPAIMAELRRTWQMVGTTGTLPPLGRSIAILYRLCLGQVHRRWWRVAGCKPSLVIYGHTGTADTSALELEQQAGDATTVHLLHGISTGHTFTGLSDVLITKCGHDADWHGRLGGYGRAISIARERPGLAVGGGKWALYTNYAHPTAFAEEARAVAFEQQAIDCVASVAGRLGKPASQIVYRPHPGLRALSPESQEKVAEKARQAGFESGSEPGLSEFELILTTPSTIVQDALCAGTVPVVIDLAGAGPDSVYGAYPFAFRSEAELVDAIRQVQSDRSASFQRAWDAVGPGILPSIKEIEALARKQAGG